MYRSACAETIVPTPRLKYLCSVQVSRKTYDIPSHRLPLAAAAAGFVEFSHHEALADAEACAAIIVDGAWGAHFGFHPELPESPVRLGADLVISSTHKLAGSLTQSAMLHLGDTPLADRLEPLVARAYSMTSSTSMSGILMGSLDTARRALVQGDAQIAEAVAAADSTQETRKGRCPSSSPEQMQK